MTRKYAAVTPNDLANHLMDARITPKILRGNMKSREGDIQIEIKPTNSFQLEKTHVKCYFPGETTENTSSIWVSFASLDTNH